MHLLSLEAIAAAVDGRTLFAGASFGLSSDDRVGVVGPNGVGKTTLLDILLGRITPDSGTLRLGTKLEVAYSDQLRAVLDDNQTLADNVGQGSETIVVND
ncbi:MAG: ATP-binding cassette domain-containing protein, partial [Nitriliruptoraceae bacterium]